MTTFSNRLKNLQGDTSTSAFAKQCGVPYSTMRGYLEGDSNPPIINYLPKVAEAQSVTVDYLVSGIKEKLSGTQQNEKKEEGEMLLSGIEEYVKEKYGSELGGYSKFIIKFTKQFPDYEEWLEKKPQSQNSNVA